MERRLAYELAKKKAKARKKQNFQSRIHAGFALHLF